MDAKLKHYSIEIIKMARADQEMRIANQREGAPFDSSIDQVNTARMKEVVAQIGWPSIPKVGPVASNKAWLLVQHADHDTKFQAYCLDLMKGFTSGEVAKENVAFLEDRVRGNTGRTQIYGTQWHVNKSGKFEPKPIEDESKLPQLWEGLSSYYKSWDHYKGLMQQAWEQRRPELKTNRDK